MNIGAIVFTAGLVAAASFDATQRRVPNWINLVFLSAGMAFSWSDRGGADIALGLCIAFVVILPFFYFRVYRGGDAKLLIACGAWLTTLDWLIGFAIGMLLGALHGLMVMVTDPSDRERAKRSLWLLYFSRLGTLGAEREAGSRTIPMAVSFGIGMVIVFHTDLSAVLGV